MVGRHESLRTIFPRRARGSAQVILDAADGARRRLARRRRSSASGRCRSASGCDAAQRGFDLASEPPLRAHLFALGRSDEHVLLLLLHHIAGDGWSLAPLVRDLGRAYAARCDGRPPQLAPLPVQYADYTLWQHEVLGAEDDAESAMRGSWRSGERARWASRSARAADATGRVLRWRATAAAACRCCCRPSCTRGSAGAGAARAGRACSWCCRRACGAADAAGRRPRHPDRQPDRGRTDSALDDLVGFFVNTLVLRTDTSRRSELPRAARPGARDQPGGLHPPGPAVRAAGRGAQPGALAGRHPLFQVMLVLQNNAGAALELPGLTPRVRAGRRPRAPSSTCR